MNLTNINTHTLSRILWASLVVIGIVGVVTFSPPQPTPQTTSTATEAAEVSSVPEIIKPVILQRRSETASAAAQLELLSVVVKPNESFWQLARKHCGSHRYSESIAQFNGYTDVHKLRAGAKITIVCAFK